MVRQQVVDGYDVVWLRFRRCRPQLGRRRSWVWVGKGGFTGLVVGLIGLAGCRDGYGRERKKNKTIKKEWKIIF